MHVCALSCLCWLWVFTVGVLDDVAANIPTNNSTRASVNLHILFWIVGFENFETLLLLSVLFYMFLGNERAHAMFLCWTFRCASE